MLELNLEVHFRLPVLDGNRRSTMLARAWRTASLWRALHNAGMLPFSKGPNIEYSRGDSVEYSFVNRRLLLRRRRW